MRNKFQVILSILILGSFLFMQSCSKDDNSPTESAATGTIQGQVTDENGGTVISNATVVTNPPTISVLTNQNGEYTIGDVNAGTYTVKASKTGFSDNTVSALVVAGKTTTSNIQLTVATAPSAPTLSSPNNGATNISNSPTLMWNASSGATSYTLQVSSNNSFTSFLYNQSGLTGNSQQITGLNNSTIYYWRVNATNSYGTSGWSSPVWIFITTTGTGGGVPCPGTPTVTYSGKTYNTVQIGNQCWLKENLDVGTRINGSQDQTNNGTIEKYCYDDDPNNCTLYGGLYQWEETMQYVTNEGAKGICPSGWHIPTEDEYYTLCTTVGNNGNALKAIGQGTGSGAGTNTSGFSVLLAGDRFYYGGNFGSLGKNSRIWNSTEYDAAFAKYLFLWDDGNGVSPGHAYYKTNGYSVRCLKD